MQLLNSFKSILPHIRHLREGLPSTLNKYKAILYAQEHYYPENEINPAGSPSSLSSLSSSSPSSFSSPASPSSSYVEELPPAFGELQSQYNAPHFYYDKEHLEELIDSEQDNIITEQV